MIDGCGQFICGHKTCSSRDALRSWEVNFAYTEHGERRNALVKVRLCTDCSAKLNYRSRKREVKKLRKVARKSKRKSRSSTGDKGGAGSTAGHEDTDANDTDADAKSEAMGDEAEQASTAKSAADAGQCWSKVATVEEKSREEEFDEYLEDLLL